MSASTFDAFVDAAQSVLHELPVVTDPNPNPNPSPRGKQTLTLTLTRTLTLTVRLPPKKTKKNVCGPGLTDCTQACANPAHKCVMATRSNVANLKQSCGCPDTAGEQTKQSKAAGPAGDTNAATGGDTAAGGEDEVI